MSVHRNSLYILGICCIGVLYAMIHFNKIVTQQIKIQDDLTNKNTEYEVRHMKEVVVKDRKSRLPDIIGIGTEKCGTGALQFYLRKHPLVTVGHKETHFFTRFSNDKDINMEVYKNLLANATDEEFVMEKTPAYFNFFPRSNIPGRIISHVPNAKIWVILCDPAKRVLSDFVHEKNTHLLSQELDFKQYMEPKLELTNQSLNGLLNNDELTINYINQQMARSYLSHMYTTGLYYYHLKQWFKYYNKRNLIIVDGENLIENPFEEVSKVEKFMGLPSVFKKEHFVMNETTGFYCVYMNETSSTDELPPCLGGRKGNTRKKPDIWEEHEDTLKKIKEFYKPYNEKLFDMLNRTFDW